MQAGQTFLSVLPANGTLARRQMMTGRWDGLLTLVPFGRRPLHFAGREIAAIWCLTVPVVPVPLLLVAAAYRNRFHLSAVTAGRWHGRAKAIAAALDDELNRPPPRGVATSRAHRLPGCRRLPPVPNTRRPATMPAENSGVVS